MAIDREGAYFALNQNSREPVTEPDELLPLWKLLHKVGYHTMHLWTLICLSMGILGENERTYLGPDLTEYGL